jgi:branched-chain amino acid transport system permease protein
MISPSITSTEARPLAGRAWLPRALAIVCAAAVVALAWMSSDYIATVLGFAAIYAVFCTGLNLFMGYTGQASFGQNAFAAIGGYGTAVLTDRLALGPLPAMLISAALAGLLALLVGYPTLRLRGHYLAMATFALGLITYEISIEWTGLTQGYMGYSGIPPLGIAGYELATVKGQLVVLALVALLGIFVSLRLRHSRFGRALRAIAGSEAAAAALGINVARYKLAAFIIAALYASVAGSLFAHFVGFISPEVFGTSMVVLGFTMLYLGGIGTIWGPVIGALIASLLPELLRSFLPAGLKEMQDIVFAALLIVILIFVPRGLSSLGTKLRRAH